MYTYLYSPISYAASHISLSLSYYRKDNSRDLSTTTSYLVDLECKDTIDYRQRLSMDQLRTRLSVVCYRC